MLEKLVGRMKRSEEDEQWGVPLLVGKPLSHLSDMALQIVAMVSALGYAPAMIKLARTKREPGGSDQRKSIHQHRVPLAWVTRVFQVPRARTPITDRQKCPIAERGAANGLRLDEWQFWMWKCLKVRGL
ncbi:hypothetical protein NDU88_002959 [Pleurodeles waltl]|uniref:Uncharacterized protein n=1 Tax=Pleurodeles waltl TaxID=8319 RepID=A0AAV7P864_PLEWA|nr:hypothetical protein NDU88_002959 [Pleurodeles waltl]